MSLFRSKIGLALGGGAAKGAAHIGVLKALEEQNIQLHGIAGNSVGAVIAALYAFGKTTDEIHNAARDISVGAVSGFTLKKKGFSTTERLQSLLHEQLGDVNIEDAKIPLAVVATHLTSGEKTVFTKGNLAKAVAASAAVPGFFVPVEIDGVEYVDGVLVENVPVSALKPLGANVVIAVNLNGGEGYPAPVGVVDVIISAFDIAINTKTNSQLRDANVVIALDLRRYSRTDNREQTDELVDLGYQATYRSKDRIRWCLYTPLLQMLLRFYQQITPITMPDFIRKFRQRYQSKTD